jgi:hypothetical protein
VKRTSFALQPRFTHEVTSFILKNSSRRTLARLGDARTRRCVMQHVTDRHVDPITNRASPGEREGAEHRYLALAGTHHRYLAVPVRARW